MLRKFSTILFLLFLFQGGFSFAQSQEDWSSKIYSGYFYKHSEKSQGSLWHVLFGKKSPKNKEDGPAEQCAIEFKSPIAYTHELMAQVPEELTYFIRFNSGTTGASEGKMSKASPPFEKFIIKIVTNDEQEYEINPDAEGKQIGINDEHHIFDSYLIYLILGQDINHLELIGPSQEDKFILDKLEIRNND